MSLPWNKQRCWVFSPKLVMLPSQSPAGSLYCFKQKWWRVLAKWWFQQHKVWFKKPQGLKMLELRSKHIHSEHAHKKLEGYLIRTWCQYDQRTRCEECPAKDTSIWKEMRWRKREWVQQMTTAWWFQRYFHCSKSSVQNQSVIPLYWLFHIDSPFLDNCNPQYGGLLQIGVPLFHGIFHYKSSSYWGGSICGNP